VTVEESTGVLAHWGNGRGVGAASAPRPSENMRYEASPELKLFQRTYDFLVWVFAKTDGFPKSKRFSVGLRLEMPGLRRAEIAPSGAPDSRAVLQTPGLGGQTIQNPTSW